MEVAEPTLFNDGITDLRWSADLADGLDAELAVGFGDPAIQTPDDTAGIAHSQHSGR